MNIALVSPSKKLYSETFIEAHKEQLKGKIFFYYGGEIPNELEGVRLINSRKSRILDIIKGHFNINSFSLAEQALISSFKKNNIELIFAEYGTTGQSLLPVAEELGLPLIVHFHGFDASRYSTIKSNNNYRKLFNYASYVVVVSRKMEKDLLALGCPTEKLIYNVYGPREEFNEVAPKFSKSQFVAIGRFVNKKAPYYLILSFKEVIAKYPEAKLIIAGDGNLLSACKNLTNYYGLNESIQFPGIITGDKYREYLSESLAMVQHSITAENGDSEGTPVAILEASAAGLPIIATVHGGIPDIIENNKTGFLVDEHDVKGFTDKMLFLLKDKAAAKELGQRGKENIKTNFNLNRHIKVLNNLIGQALNNNLQND